MVAVFEKASKIVETRNLGWQNERLGLPVEREVSSRARALVMGFAQPFNLNFANGLADPFGSPRLGGTEENFSRGLREHGLGIFPVAGLHLAPSLKAQDNRVL